MAAVSIFATTTRHGDVRREVRERYVRTDLGCGTLHKLTVDAHYLAKLARDRTEPYAWLVPDTNVVLHQMDALERMPRLVVTQTVVEEVRHRDRKMAKRLIALVEDEAKQVVLWANEHCSGARVPAFDERNKHRKDPEAKTDSTPNDRNDRALRVATRFLERALRRAGAPNAATLVTDDADNRRRATEDGTDATSTRAVCEALGLSEFVAADADVDARRKVSDDNLLEDEPKVDHAKGAGGLPLPPLVGTTTQEPLFSPHLPMSALNAGVSQGTLRKGVLRCARRSPWRATVVADDGTVYFIDGAKSINRAVDGDLVAIEPLMAGTANMETGLARPEEEEEEEDDEAPREEDGAGVVGDVLPDEEPQHNVVVDGVKAEPRQRAGRVVGVVRRNWRQSYPGTVAADGRFFVPSDTKIPKILLERPPARRHRFLHDTQEDPGAEFTKPTVTRALAALDAWPAHSRYPRGHFVETLGEAGDAKVETEVLLRQHDVSAAAFSPRVMACLPDQADKYAFTETERRTDFRDTVTVCSIDPPSCRDIDDALHCRVVSDDVWEVGVHIADVTHFCLPGSALDKEASERGTSTYLVDRRLDMLPKLLTETLCSLRAGVDRYAFSAIIKLRKSDATIVEPPHFCKSIIRSKAALSYPEAQLMISSTDDTSDVAQSVRRLASLARSLRQRRFDRGALALASPEVRFELSNESDSPTDVAAYQLVEANATVEEFMLLANVCVAERILKAFPGLALLRHHPRPAPDQFAPLIAKANAAFLDTSSSSQQSSGGLVVSAERDVVIDASSNKALATSLDKIASLPKAKKDPYLDRLVRVLATRCMAPAKYFCAADKPKHEWAHYGLAADVYTHFTSPIRRYADVVVHRLLSAAIEYDPLPPGAFETKRYVADLATHLNRKSKNAQYAARDSVGLYTRLYFRDRPQPKIEARVLDIDASGRIDVLVPRFGVEGPLRLPDGDEQSSRARVDAPRSVTLSPSGRTLRVLDTLHVAVSVVETPLDPLGDLRLDLVDVEDVEDDDVEDFEDDVEDDDDDQEQDPAKGQKTSETTTSSREEPPPMAPSVTELCQKPPAAPPEGVVKEAADPAPPVDEEEEDDDVDDDEDDEDSPPAAPSQDVAAPVPVVVDEVAGDTTGVVGATQRETLPATRRRKMEQALDRIKKRRRRSRSRHLTG